MPRHARIDFPGLLQHVIVRGIDRTHIFLDDRDRENLFQRMKTMLDKTGTHCFAWCLLDNHFHLLLRPVDISLASFMRRLLTGYAVSFNLRHNRTGHLFQNRYKSIVCEEEAYLLELIRYIHLNPIRAGIIDDLDQLECYSWCGHPQIIGVSEQNLICTHEVLSRFSRNAVTARQKYLEFLADGLRLKSPPVLSRGGRVNSDGLDSPREGEAIFDERILGGDNFSRAILDKQKEPPPQPSLERLIITVVDYYAIDNGSIAFPSKERIIVQAKRVICYLAIRCFFYSGVDVAHRLGYSTSAASHATKHGERLFKEDEALKKEIAKMWK